MKGRHVGMRLILHRCLYRPADGVDNARACCLANDAAALRKPEKSSRSRQSPHAHGFCPSSLRRPGR